MTDLKLPIMRHCLFPDLSNYPFPDIDYFPVTWAKGGNDNQNVNVFWRQEELPLSRDITETAQTVRMFHYGTV